MSEEEELEEQSKRPKIVDKRISAGGHSPPPKPPTESTPEAAAATPPLQAPNRSESPSGATSSSPAEGDVSAATDSKRSGGSAGASPGAEEQVWTPEQEAQARQIIEQIVATPALDWILNSAVNLANVAGTKLEAGQLEDAQLAIDGFAALIDGLSGRLQDA